MPNDREYENQLLKLQFVYHAVMNGKGPMDQRVQNYIKVNSEFKDLLGQVFRRSQIQSIPIKDRIEGLALVNKFFQVESLNYRKKNFEVFSREVSKSAIMTFQLTPEQELKELRKEYKNLMASGLTNDKKSMVQADPSLRSALNTVYDRTGPSFSYIDPEVRVAALKSVIKCLQGNGPNATLESITQQRDILKSYDSRLANAFWEIMLGLRRWGLNVYQGMSKVLSMVSSNSKSTSLSNTENLSESAGLLSAEQKKSDSTDTKQTSEADPENPMESP